MLLSLN